MIKKCIYYTSIAIIVAFISLGFKPLVLENQDWFFTNTSDKKIISKPTLEDVLEDNFNILYTGKSFTGFKEKLAFRESRGMYHMINSFGYMGKYQFGNAALRAIGIQDSSEFLRNPRLQEKAFNALLAKNKWELRKEIETYDGKIIDGIKITESGILASAHLVGAGSVKKFFRHNGKTIIKDGYGTSLKNYMKSFEGYDTSFIVADSNARVKM